MENLINTILCLVSGNSFQVNSSSDAAQFHNALNRFLANIDAGNENVINARSRVGSRLNALDSQENTNDSFSLSLKTSVSDLKDLDYAEAVSRFNTQLVGLQAAQQAFVRVQNLSLFNFLR